MPQCTLSVALVTLLMLQGGFIAEAKTPLHTECGANSAAVIKKNAAACIASLNSSKECSKECNRIKDAILHSKNPTKCQKATVFSAKFVANAAAKKKYIQLCTPTWRPEDIGFATAGSAFAPFYYYGVMETLISQNILNPKTARLGGLSGGAIVSLGVCGGAPPKLMQAATVSAVTECVNTWNKTTQMVPCQGELTALLLNLADLLFPANSTTFQEKCAGRVRIAMSKYDDSKSDLISATPYIVDKFETNQDVYSAITGTSMISCLSTCKPYSLFKGLPMGDGGYTSTFKQMCPENVKRCVKTQEYYPGKYVKPGGDACLKNGKNPVKAGTKIPCTTPVPSSFKFAPKGNLPTSCPAGSEYFQPPGQADIYPGMHNENPLPYTCSEWQNFSYFPVVSTFETQFQAGKKDAFLWGQKEGLIP